MRPSDLLLAAIAEQYGSHFRESLGPIRKVGREAEFPVVLPDGRAGDWPDLVLADLAVPDSIAAIELLVQAGVRVIAFGPHVDRAALRSARQAGAEQALARSVFFEKLGDMLA